jgi:PIN domain nuclease of toxin-antitoxin system
MKCFTVAKSENTDGHARFAAGPRSSGSAVSIAEISIKVSIGKLTVNSDILEAVDNAGFDLIDFTPKEADVLKNLPFHHKDPFDRMLIAQGIVNDYPVLTDDPKFTLYDCRVL